MTTDKDRKTIQDNEGQMPNDPKKDNHVTPCDDLSCEKCCDHSDLDEHYVCLICDRDCLEDKMGGDGDAAYDRIKESRWESES